MLGLRWQFALGGDSVIRREIVVPETKNELGVSFELESS